MLKATKTHKIIGRSLLCALMLILAAPNSFADTTTRSIKRTETTPLEVAVSFEKAIYKTVYRDEPYSVEVPYQTTETYYEDVPYYDTEVYYENVPYYETETYYETVPYQYQEWVCNHSVQPFSKTKMADIKSILARGPGDSTPPPPNGGGDSSGGRGGNNGGGHGGGRGGDNGGGGNNGGGHGGGRGGDNGGGNNGGGNGGGRGGNGGDGCHWETRTGYRQEARTRTVVKYRSERRTRTVTRYRREERTRTVTRYRTEERCCNSVAHSEFDHNWKQDVLVRFPQETALRSGETESINLNLQGEEGNPSVTLNLSDAIFHYKIGSVTNTAAQLVVDLAFTPHITKEQAGLASIKSIVAVIQPTKADIRFQDLIQNPRVDSKYLLRIFELGSLTPVGETTLTTRNGSLVTGSIAGSFNPDRDYTIKISVERNGIVLVAPIQFETNTDQFAEEIDRAKLENDKLLALVGWRGAQALSVIKIEDRSPVYRSVSSEYEVRVLDFKDKTLILEGKVDRASLKVDSEKNTLIPVKDSLGASSEALAKLILGKIVTVEIKVNRITGRYGKLTFPKKEDMKIR